MEKIKAYLSKDLDGCVTIWENEPKFHTKGYFTIKKKDIPQNIITITDDYPQLENLVKEGQCVEITITKGNVVYDYNESPEGKMLNTIFKGEGIMTHDEALNRTKTLLRTLVPKSVDYNLAICDANEKGDMEWFKRQLDEVIEMCNELKEAL